MTHDELLEKIYETINDSPVTEPHHPTYLGLNALRTIVELHKPVEFIPEWKPRCNDCEIFYPCPTIQAIEKELG